MSDSKKVDRGPSPTSPPDSEHDSAVALAQKPSMDGNKAIGPSAQVNGQITGGITQSPVQVLTASLAATSLFASVERYDSKGNRISFTTDVDEQAAFRGCHYAKIFGVPEDKCGGIYARLQKETWWKGVLDFHTISSPDKPGEISIFLCFDELTQGIEAFKDVRDLASKGVFDCSPVIQYINQQEYADKALEEKTAPYDGQVSFRAWCQDSTKQRHPDGIVGIIRSIAERYGKILSFADSGTSTALATFRVEFSSISAARSVILALPSKTPALFQGWYIHAEQLTDRLIEDFDAPLTERQFRPMVHGPVSHEAVHKCSRTGRSQWIEQGGQAYPVDRRQAPNPRKPPYKNTRAPQRGAGYRSSFGNGRASGRRSFNELDHIDDLPLPVRENLKTASHDRECHSNPYLPCVARNSEQHILHWKVAGYQDLRCSIMVRNIPRHWTAIDFKKMLDTKSHGKYDFSYLRFDFEKGTNVGYGFVNFTNVSHVREFIEEYGAKRWPPTEKQGSIPLRDARMSYGTIQGIEGLIMRFRNSVVMDEFSGWSPKLWHTFESAQAFPNPLSIIGTERAFPSPDNSSKKQRSINNAESEGLYGANNRHGRRSRHSQFDRGNPAQVREDAMWNGQAAWNQQSFYNHNQQHFVNNNYAAANAYQPNNFYPPFQGQMNGGYPAQQFDQGSTHHMNAHSGGYDISMQTSPLMNNRYSNEYQAVNNNHMGGPAYPMNGHNSGVYYNNSSPSTVSPPIPNYTAPAAPRMQQPRGAPPRFGGPGNRPHRAFFDRSNHGGQSMHAHHQMNNSSDPFYGGPPSFSATFSNAATMMPPPPPPPQMMAGGSSAQNAFAVPRVFNNQQTLQNPTSMMTASCSASSFQPQQPQQQQQQNAPLVLDPTRYFSAAGRKSAGLVDGTDGAKGSGH